MDELRTSGVGDEVAGWRENALAAGQTVTGDDQRQFALSVIHRRLRRVAERDIANGVGAFTAAEDDEIAQAVLDDMFGAGMLDRLLADPMVENIDAVGCDRVWVSYADGRKELGPQLWRTDAEMIEHLRRLGARTGQSERRFDHASVDLNLQLASGARLFAVMAVTERPCVSVRRHRKATASLDELRGGGTFDRRLEEFLIAAVRARLNVLVAGGTNAGKTTLLRALLAQTDPAERLITIEDNRELNLPACAPGHLDLVEMEAREPNTEGEGAVTMADLVRMGLRMNPSRVIVGEVRGAEVIPMLNAMSQGNDGSMCTIHASSSDGVFDRIAAYCIQAPERLDRIAANLLAANAVDLVVFVAQALTSDGPVRRVTSVREVVGADDHLVVTNEIFRLDSREQAAVPTGVPLRPDTAQRLRAVGYAWVPATSGPMS
ncbi:MAG: Flp pilus assembly complex ATPase component TadA [Acidimicrobiales bacterium]|nr:Flp pilus assembly complex ATPase component TadA [Acidimicrobiales bacterium]